MELPFPKKSYVYHRLKQRGNVPDDSYVELGADVFLPHDSKTGQEIPAPEGGFTVLFLIHGECLFFAGISRYIEYSYVCIIGGGFTIGDRQTFPAHEVQEAHDRKWAVVTMDVSIASLPLSHVISCYEEHSDRYVALPSVSPRPCGNNPRNE